MRRLLTQISHSLGVAAGRVNHAFGGRYKPTRLESSIALAYAYKYIARNPVRAGIVQSVEDYPYSTINPSPTLSGPPISEGFDSYWQFIPKEQEKRLKWLNTPVEQSEDFVRLALRRERFAFTKDKNARARLTTLAAVYDIPMN